MAISEVCKFEVKEEIDHLVKKNGVSRNEASKELAAWFTEILGKEIKPGTIRQKDLRARQELATNVATEDWPKCKKCGNFRVKHRWVSTDEPGDMPGSTRQAKEPMEHGLCRDCRSRELAEEKAKKAKKEFKETPIDLEVDKFWSNTDISISLYKIEQQIITGKVSKKTLEKVLPIHERISAIFGLTSEVIEKSTFQGAT
jgi:hypothetical protein